MKITYIDNSGSANWYDVNGEAYGVSEEGDILDCDGLKYPEEWISQNWQLADKLKEISLSA